MNQLESAFGSHDDAPSSGVSSPVVIIGENPDVWLGPNYDKDEGSQNEKQKEGVASWEMVNEQIRQNMAGNVRVLKEMVSGLERGQTRMDMFGTTTDKLHQKIHILTDRVVALESFASTITPTVKELMSTVNTLVYNIQGFAGSAEQSSMKAQKKLQRATDAVNHTNEKKVSFADEKGKSLKSISPPPPPEIFETEKNEELSPEEHKADPSNRMTPNTANEYTQIVRKNSAKIIQRNWKIYRHNKLLRSMADMTKKRVKKELSLANRLKSLEESIKQMQKEKEEDNSVQELLEKVWEEVEKKADKVETRAIKDAVSLAAEQLAALQQTVLSLSDLRSEIEKGQEEKIKLVEETFDEKLKDVNKAITVIDAKFDQIDKKIEDTKPPEVDLTGFLREDDLNHAVGQIDEKIVHVEQNQLKKDDIEYEVKPVKGQVRTLENQMQSLRETNDALTMEANSTREKLLAEMENMAALRRALDGIREQTAKALNKETNSANDMKTKLTQLQDMLQKANDRSKQKNKEMEGMFGSLRTRIKKQNNSLVSDLNGLKIEVSKKAGEEVVQEAFEKIENEIAPVTSAMNDLQGSVDARTTKQDVVKIVNQIKIEAEEKGKGSAGIKCLMCNQDIVGLSKPSVPQHKELPLSTALQKQLIEIRMFGGGPSIAHPLRRSGALRPVQDRSRSPMPRDGYGPISNNYELKQWGREQTVESLYNEKVTRSSVRKRAARKPLKPMAYNKDGHLKRIHRSNTTMPPPQIIGRVDAREDRIKKPKGLYQYEEKSNMTFHTGIKTMERSL